MHARPFLKLYTILPILYTATFFSLVFYEKKALIYSESCSQFASAFHASVTRKLKTLCVLYPHARSVNVN